MAEEKKLINELNEKLTDEQAEAVEGGQTIGRRVIGCSKCNYSAWDYVWIANGGKCPKCGAKYGE